MTSIRTGEKMLASEARHRCDRIVYDGVRLYFLWISSHAGLKMHERTDEFAKAYDF